MEPVPLTSRSRSDAAASGARHLAVDDARGFRLLALSAGRLRIGGGVACDVRVEDVGVGRRHAELLVGPDGVEIVDAQSRTGTWVNGERVVRATLRHGDAIRVGRTLLCYVEEPARAAGASGALDAAAAA